MKCRIRISGFVVVVTLLAALALTVPLAAQNEAKPDHPHQYHHYQIVDPGTFGGPANGLQNFGIPRAGVLSNNGTLVGWANTPATDPYCGFGGTCNAGDAFQYHDGVTTGLGRLPGGIDSQANWISGNGLIAGLGDNGQLDPLAGFPIAQSRGLLWENGIMTDLGSLPEGGYLVFPSAVNNQGEVVGLAQNTVPDPNSMFTGYGTQTRAFYWKHGVMQDLGTLGTGTDAIAALINERGQVVGWSYTNSSPTGVSDCTNSGLALATGSFLWDQKSGMRDIGGLGGTCTIAQDFNDRGQIVGGASSTGDSTEHAFVWNASTGVTDLMDPSDSSYGFAKGENNHGDVAGGTCDAVTCYAVLWRNIGGQWQRTNLSTINDSAFSISINSSVQVVGNWSGGIFLSEGGGPIMDLSTLLPPNSSIQLGEADQINDRGEIAAWGADASGNGHALLLIPCDENHPNVTGCDYDLIDAATAAARVSPASTTTRPVPQTPGTRMPRMLNRFPKSRVPGRGTAPPAASTMALSTNPATTDWLDDRKLAPADAQSAYCEISSGKLTGFCVETRGGACAKVFSGCPTGESATSGGETSCLDGSVYIVSTTQCWSLPGFDLSASALTPTSVSAGGSATSTLTAVAYGGFSGSVTFTCIVTPTPAQAPTCSISPTSVAHDTPATLTVSTTAPSAAMRASSAGSGLFVALGAPLLGLVGIGFGSHRKSRKAQLTVATFWCVLFAGLMLQAACGGGSSTPTRPGTPPGAYTITVTGTDSSGTLVSSITMPKLTVQ